MEIKEQGHTCMYPFSVVGILVGRSMHGLDSVPRNPQTACQHKSITMRSGPADLKYKNATTSTCVCVCVSVCILSMFHDLNTYCDTSVQNNTFMHAFANML